MWMPSFLCCTIENMKQLIEHNAEECRRLHARIHETLKQRNSSREKKAEWELACQEFHARYDALAFPGGYSGALERIASGDEFTIEAALCFVEVRPYFFRSGYMLKALLPKLKKAKLSSSQTARLETCLAAREEWRMSHPKPEGDNSGMP
jgi:hypothetical protein